MLSIFLLARQIWLPFISDYNNSRMARTENCGASLYAEMSQMHFDPTDKPRRWNEGISMLASKPDAPSMSSEAFSESRPRWTPAEKPYCFFSLASSVSAFSNQDTVKSPLAKIKIIPALGTISTWRARLHAKAKLGPKEVTHSHKHTIASKGD